MIALISSIASAIGSFFNWKSSSVQQHKAAKSLVESEKKKRDKRKHKINKAVHEGDSSIVNDIVSAFAITFVSFSLIGCVLSDGAAEKVYVSADRKCEVATNSVGIVGWFVPNVIMEELLNSKVELEELKTEHKIKEITR